MIAEHTKAAIIALINVDPGASDADRQRVTLALSGTRPLGRTIRLREAARIMGVHRNTIANWIRSGRLVPVKGPNGRVFGVAEASITQV